MTDQDKGMEQFNEVVFTVTPEEGSCLLREYLREKKKISRRRLSSLKNEGKILCNGAEVTVRCPVSPGDKITLYFPYTLPSEYLQPEPLDLDIIFEDGDILVLNKQPGICVHPTFEYGSGTLANGIIDYYRKKGEIAGFHPIHRLDKDTSGVLVSAKNPFSAQQLNMQLKKKQLNRSYLAVVHGVLKNDKGEIDLPIARKDARTVEREINPIGKKAVTRYQVIERFVRHTLVSFSLLTGRTHQIRVHMSYLGHPLVGDGLYGGSLMLLNRQALHADRVEFFHPRNGRIMNFFLPLPGDMESLINYLREK